MDDLKISHKEDLVIKDIVSKLNKYFVKEEPLKFNKGLVHEYLSTTIDYRKHVKLQVSMLKYIDKLLG